MQWGISAQMLFENVILISINLTTSGYLYTIIHCVLAGL